MTVRLVPATLEPVVVVSVADDQDLVSALLRRWLRDDRVRFVGSSGRGQCTFTMPAELLESLRAFLVEQGVARQALLGVEDLCS